MLKAQIQRPTIKSVTKRPIIRAVILSQTEGAAKGIIKRPVIRASLQQNTIRAVLGRGTSVPGPKGDKGDPGESGVGDLNYTQNFTNTDTVVVPHNLGKYPSVVVFDSAEDEVEGNIQHNGINELTITFSAPFSGKVVCN